MPSLKLSLEKIQPPNQTSEGPLIIRASDIQSIECKRQWYWYRNWTPGNAAAPLWLGEMGHAGLQSYYQNHRDVELARRKMTLEFSKIATRIGQSHPQWFDLAFQQVDIARALVDHYMQYDQEIEHLSGEIRAVERRLTQFVRDPDTGEIDETVALSGKIDLALDRPNGLMIVDHKFLSDRTMMGRPDEAVLVDGQLTAYAYLWWRAFDEVPSRVMINFALKNVPARPERIKGGTALSRAKEQTTTPAIYRAELRAMGLNEADYEDVLRNLEKTSYKRFFQRVDARRNEAELIAFERRLWLITRELKALLADPDRLAYPSGSIYRCGYCPFLQACKVHDDGGDSGVVLSSFLPADLEASM